MNKCLCQALHAASDCTADQLHAAAQKVQSSGQSSIEQHVVHGGQSANKCSWASLPDRHMDLWLQALLVQK